MPNGVVRCLPCLVRTSPSSRRGPLGRVLSSPDQLGKEALLGFASYFPAWLSPPSAAPGRLRALAPVQYPNPVGPARSGSDLQEVRTIVMIHILQGWNMRVVPLQPCLLRPGQLLGTSLLPGLFSCSQSREDCECPGPEDYPSSTGAERLLVAIHADLSPSPVPHTLLDRGYGSPFIVVPVLV